MQKHSRSLAEFSGETTLTGSLFQEVYRVQQISEEIPTFRDCKSVKKISYSPFVLFIFWEVGEWWVDTYRRLHLPVNAPAKNMFSTDVKRLCFRCQTLKFPAQT